MEVFAVKMHILIRLLACCYISEIAFSLVIMLNDIPFRGADGVVRL